MSSAMDVSGAEGAWPRSKARMSGPETGKMDSESSVGGAEPGTEEVPLDAPPQQRQETPAGALPRRRACRASPGQDPSKEWTELGTEAAPEGTPVRRVESWERAWRRRSRAAMGQER